MTHYLINSCTFPNSNLENLVPCDMEPQSEIAMQI